MNTKEKQFSHHIKHNEFFKSRLLDVGAKKDCTGFYFVVYILDLLINKAIRTKSYSKHIYPLVAKKFNKHVSCIERDIRTLIDKSWNNDMKSSLNKVRLFENKPTCRKFISAMYDYIIAEIS